MKGLTAQGQDSWATPQYIFDQFDKQFGFEIDTACDSSNAKCDRAFMGDSGYDGLKESWTGRAWCNPPFSEKEKWIIKAHDEVLNGNCPLCVMILPLNSISRKVFHTHIDGKFHYEILQNRIAFIDPETGESKKGNNTGTVVIYFKNKVVI